jgi:hypothetical protein
MSRAHVSCLTVVLLSQFFRSKTPSTYIMTESITIYSSIRVYIYIYTHTHTHTHTHITSGWAGCELHEVELVCFGDVNTDPLGQISLLCILIQYEIYLLQLSFNPVAVVFTLVRNRQEQNIHKEK